MQNIANVGILALTKAMVSKKKFDISNINKIQTKI